MATRRGSWRWRRLRTRRRDALQPERARAWSSGSTRSPGPGTSGSWPTSTRARRPRPSGSCTTPASPTRSARSTRARRRWTGWSRSASGASPSPPPPRPHVEGPLDQHHRHARPRGLHGRGRTVAARAGRRGGRVRRRRRRRAADRDGLAPGRPVRRPADLLRQQDGPDGRRLRADRRDDRGPAHAVPLVVQLPWGREAVLHGRHRPHRDEGPALGRGGMGESWETVEIPAELRERGRGVAPPAVRAAGRPRRARSSRSTCTARSPPWRSSGARSARPRCRRGHPVLCGSAFKNKAIQPLLDAIVGLPASPLDVPPMHGQRPRGRRGRARAERRRAVLRARVQDHVRPVRGAAHLHPGVLGHAPRRAPT